MDTIDNNVMQRVAELLIHANRDADIHTVTITLNGQHGGADVDLHGFRHPSPKAVTVVYDEFTQHSVVH